MRMTRELFEELVRAHHAAVFRTAHRVVRSEADAADVTQQVFLSVWRRGFEPASDRADSERRLRWLAGRLALTSLRAARRRARHEQEIARMTPTSTVRPTVETADAELVRRQLDALEPSARATLVLRYQEGMTLAAIGEAIGCAESTVHSRVRAALDTLRRRLEGMGFALVGVDLERLLTTVDQPIVVPPSLQVSLLAIPSAAGSLLVAKIAATAILALTVGGTALAISARPFDEPLSSERTARSATAMAEPTDLDRPQDPERRRVQSTPPVLPAPPRVGGDRSAAVPRYADAPRAHVSGTVGAVDGSPMQGARIVAWCRELSSKGESFEVTATTDVAGRYELELPITHPDGLDYRLSVKRDDWIGQFDPFELRLRPSDFRRGIDAAMRRWASDTAGSWRREVVVTDRDGRGVAEVAVRVFRRIVGADGKETLVDECNGKSDAAGRVALDGDHLGEKLVRVVAFGLPFARIDRALAIEGAEGSPISIAVPDDVPLRARVVDARTGQPVPRVAVTAERGPDTLAFGMSDEQGAILMRGVDGDPLTLAGGGGEWSRFRLGDVSAGGREIELRIKRLDDPTAIGLSRGEIHGRVIDVLTGQPMAVELGAVGTYWVAAESTETADALIARSVTPWPFQTCLAMDPPPPSSQFHLELPQPGRYFVLLRHPERAISVKGPFLIEEGSVVSDVTLEAEPGIELRVEVRDAAGAPVAGAEVWVAGAGAQDDVERRERSEQLARARESGERARSGRGHLTDADGRIVMPRLPTGVELRVHVVDEDRHQAASVPFRLVRGGQVHSEILVLR